MELQRKKVDGTQARPGTKLTGNRVGIRNQSKRRLRFAPLRQLHGTFLHLFRRKALVCGAGQNCLSLSQAPGLEAEAHPLQDTSRVASGHHLKITSNDHRHGLCILLGVALLLQVLLSPKLFLRPSRRATTDIPAGQLRCRMFQWIICMVLKAKSVTRPQQAIMQAESFLSRVRVRLRDQSRGSGQCQRHRQIGGQGQCRMQQQN